jgi:hypothetical protein
MVVVSEAYCDHKGDKMKTLVKVVAGHHAAQTDPSSNGKFQQPLHIHVEQGTEKVTIELHEENKKGALASMSMRTWEDILTQKGIDKPQKRLLVLPKDKKAQRIANPSVTFYMSVGDALDEETGLLASSHMGDLHSDTKIMLQQQLKRAAKSTATRSGVSSDHTSEEGVSEIQQLKRACAGSLDMFEGFGGTRTVYLAVRGPPDSRSWILGIWSDKEDFERRGKGIKEIDVKRIKGVQHDPQRTNVFAINYFDQNRVPQREQFRIRDLNRDVWVNMLKMMVDQVRKADADVKKKTSIEKTRKHPSH